MNNLEQPSQQLSQNLEKLENRKSGKVVFIVLSVFIFLSFLVSVYFNFYYKKVIVESQDKIRQKEEQVAQFSIKMEELEKQLGVTEEREEGKDFWAHYKECQNSCYQYASKMEVANLQNKCLEDCRIEMERVNLLVRENGQVDLESEFNKDFFRNYLNLEKPLSYILINNDLSKIFQLGDYIGIHSQNVYKITLGNKDYYRVVLFPYHTELTKEDGKITRAEIKKIEDFEDVYVDQDGEVIDCDEEEYKQICNSIRAYGVKDISSRMLLDCGDKHCNFLEAVRTNDSRKCDYINQYSLVDDSDVQWIELCKQMIEEQDDL